MYLGRTTGRGKDAPTDQPNRPIKEVLGYPLSPGLPRDGCGSAMKAPETPRDPASRELKWTNSSASGAPRSTR